MKANKITHFSNDDSPVTDVASALLVSMPWTNFDQPNLALGILRAVLDGRSVPCQVRHLNLELLQFLRPATYLALSKTFALNDFVFSGVLDPQVTNAQLRILREKVAEMLSVPYLDPYEMGGPAEAARQLLNLRAELIPRWLESWADRIADSDATLVGFSCNFDQTVASLALSKLIKERTPDKFIVFGGYAVRSPTAEALMRSFACIDAICIQEGEAAIGGLVSASVGAIGLSEVPGIVYKGDGVDEEGRQQLSVTPLSADIPLDESPCPNYDDYFKDVARLSEEHLVDIDVTCLPVENSRGCWWGYKSHCIFCGIKKSDLAYRHKSADRVLDDLQRLSQRHSLTTFRFADYILPHSYFSDLLPSLAALGAPYQLKAELKANVNSARFKLLRSAGFEELQPGIESFSSEVLRFMKKGVTSVQNVHLLRLGTESGVLIHYNILYGFPVDGAKTYRRMKEVVGRLVHLAPPSSVVPVQITRYAPMQVSPSVFDIGESVYEHSYDLIFSSGFVRDCGFDYGAFAYYFERPYENSPAVEREFRELEEEIYRWEQASKDDTRRPVLERRFTGGGAEIHDTRSGALRVYALNDIESDVLKVLTEPGHLERTAKRLSAKHGDQHVENAIKSVVEKGLVFEDEEMAVSLVVSPGTENEVSQVSKRNSLRVVQSVV